MAVVIKITDIPASRRVECRYCREVIDSNGDGTFQRGTGWFPMRKKARGSSSATNVKRHHEFACATCIDKLSHGIPPGQMGLWDD